MDRRSPITSGRRYAWLPALALAAVAVAGCSSSGGGSTAASAPPPSAGTTASSPAATVPTATTAPSVTAPTATATATATPTAPAGNGKRPADACTLLTSPQVVAAVGTAGPFTGTHPSPVDGKAVWGCTWGSRQSYAHIRESSPSSLATLKANPELTATPVPGIGKEAYLIQRKNGTHPSVYFVAEDGLVYEVEVVKDRGPNDDVNAPAEIAAESALALLLSKAV
ncbi:hypothetical protein ACFP3U_19360 [Kitasatospora misakiensis]|uniref:DUF3558 domain-containing protein n=1 Tax=Kitasatospora misakiensis TaxID=67330 RepID=A0ABW0X9H8_9ACTN